MKKLSLLTLLIGLIFCSNQIAAQNEKYQGTMYADMAPASFEWAANRLATLDALVSLTDEQKAEVEVINLRYAYRMDVLNKQTMDAEKLRAHKESLFGYRMEDYSRMLTPAQLGILKANTEVLREDNLK
jgi:hypothetical protein